jgi:hypothetical protein
MDRLKSSKINQLLRVWPRGTVAIQSWLTKQGVYRQLTEIYRKTMWLERIGVGAFKISGDKIDWTGGLWTLQTQLVLPVHVAAKTALELQGYGHFLALGKGAQIWLFGDPGVKLPLWFKEFDWSDTLRFVTADLFRKSNDVGLEPRNMGTYSITISAPERAILEALHLVPLQGSFEGIFHLMEGLTSLRTELVQRLLADCRSTKVTRLFMYMAEKCNHPWVSKLDLSHVHFGKGKRRLIKGGKFDPKYQITVPR